MKTTLPRFNEDVGGLPRGGVPAKPLDRVVDFLVECVVTEFLLPNLYFVQTQESDDLAFYINPEHPVSNESNR